MEKETFFGRDYRPEISGLRAVAVLLVLIFHVDPHLMPGGFLGVDVFLVISGYLITGNIIRDIDAGKFTFKRFYSKRFRRLFPALFFTLLAVLVYGYFILYPAEYERLGRSVLAGTFSVSNFFFLSETGYFDASSETKPLLHIWSLSLEEQFYLVWPALLFLLFKAIRKRFYLAVAALVALSILVCHVFLAEYPSTVFYMLPFRMFEFLLGAVVLWFDRHPIKQNLIREILLLFGLFLVFYSSYTFDLSTPMPGLYSLIPCGGAALVLYAGKSRFASGLLTNKPMEYIGKASYSIYLAHWPLIVFYRIWLSEEFTNFDKLVIGEVAILVGFLMWRFIENPFRIRRNTHWKIDPVWVWIPSLMILLGGGATYVWMADGMANSYPDLIFMTEDQLLEQRQKYWNNKNSVLEEFSVLEGTDTTNSVVVMGNSFSIDLIYALRYNGFEAKVTSLMTSNKCYNFGTPIAEQDSSLCGKLLAKNLADPSWATASAIFLTDHWPVNDPTGFRQRISQIRRRSQAPIFVIGPRMTFDTKVPTITLESRSFSPSSINSYAQDYCEIEENERINKTFNNMFYGEYSYGSNNETYYIDFLSLQKGEDGIYEIISDDKQLYYFDRGHFTEAGATWMGDMLKQKYPFLFSLETDSLSREYMIELNNKETPL